MKTSGAILTLPGILLAFSFSALAQQQLVPANVVAGGDFDVGAMPGGQTTKSSSSLAFYASGGGYSPDDDSTSSGAEDAAYGGGTFIGSEFLQNSAGVFDGNVSAISGGETSATGIFYISNIFTCTFQTSVTVSGDIDGHVFLTGPGGYLFQNSGGNISGRTALIAPGYYQLEADLSTGAGDLEASGNGRLTYQVSLVPAIIPTALSPAEKEAYYSQYSSLKLLNHLLLNMANSAGSDELRAALLNSIELLNQVAQLDLQASLDPVDTNYTALATITLPALIPLAPGGAITADEATAYNNWLSNTCQSAACSSALVTSLNRAQGAAFAGSSYWNSAQIAAATQFEEQFAALEDQEPLLRSNLVARFDADGFSPIAVTTSDATAFQLQVETNGLPATMLNTFSNLDLTLDTVTNIEFDLLTADPSGIAGTFPDSLANTNLDASATGLAAALRDGSMELINTTWLPTGHFRFDLPTEPGYTYGIQTSPNLASWTTVFSTNATATLLSWTNATGPGARVSFYRAYHQ